MCSMVDCVMSKVPHGFRAKYMPAYLQRTGTATGMLLAFTQWGQIRGVGGLVQT